MRRPQQRLTGPRARRERPREWRRCSVAHHQLGGSLTAERVSYRRDDNREEGRTENLAVHHDLPGIDGEVGVVEAPVELFRRFGLIRRIMVRRDVFVRERLGRGDTLARVEDKHLLEEVDG